MERPEPTAIDIRKLRADDLRYLLAVARTGRLVAAADALGVDHTTVSRRVMALQKSLGVRLLERCADGWALTELGRATAESAHAVEAALHRLVEQVSGDESRSLHGTVRITTPDAFGVVFATPALARLRVRHPRLTVELVTATRQLAPHQAGFDLAVTVGSLTSSRLASEPLATYALGLYCSRLYLEQHPQPESINDLRHHTLISYVDALLQVGDLEIRRHLPGMAAAFTSTNVYAQLEATRVGAGIGLLPAFLASRSDSLVRLLPEVIDLRLRYLVAARRDAMTSPLVQAVRAALHAEVQARATELGGTVGYSAQT